MKKLLILILLFSCSQEDVKKLSSELEIGQEYNDGIIFYIFLPGDDKYVEGEQHGLIVSEELGQYKWGCVNAPLIEFSEDGEYNTASIINMCGFDNAAGQCDLQGWWLPCIYEWELLLDSNVLINYELTSYYWTSDKADYSKAYAIIPSTGAINAFSVNVITKTIGIKQF